MHFFFFVGFFFFFFGARSNLGFPAIHGLGLAHGTAIAEPAFFGDLVDAVAGLMDGNVAPIAKHDQITIIRIAIVANATRRVLFAHLQQRKRPDPAALFSSTIPPLHREREARG